MEDSDGNLVVAGDTVQFSYGIPPIKVIAPVVEIEGCLWVSTPKHNPKSEKLEYIKKYFDFWKSESQDHE